MKTITKVTGALVFSAMLALGVAAQTPKPAKPTPTPKPAKAAKPVPTPKSDSDIQADIQKKLAASSKLKAEPITVSVSEGVATFAGTAKNEGNKNSVASLAKSAGAKSTVNNITVAAPPAKKK
jgi:hypothetical protein